jgi:hypothetical protein
MAPGQISTLAEIPYFARDELSRGGFIPTAMFYVDGAWRCWVGTEEPGKFIEIHGWPAESFYWGDKEGDPDDFSTLFLDFVAQRANLWSVRHAFSGIQDDLFNLSASLHKFGLIHATGGHGASRLAATEVEYVMLLCRSIFDLLQEVVAGIWDTISLTGPDGQTDFAANKRQLAKSFSDMALKANDVRPPEELTQKFGLPPTIAECYARQAPIFLKIRKFRDDIVHRGHNVRTIFHTETGFAIQRRFGPFTLEIWRPDEVGENDLAPLLPVLGLLIHGTLVACNDFAQTLVSCICFPPPMVPDLVLLMRGYFNGVLLASLKDAETRVGEGLALIKPEV